MIGQGATSWLGATPAALVALLVLMVPGWLAARLLGARGLAALAVAPGLSVTTIALAGVVAPRLGLRWGIGVLLAGSALAWLVAAAVGHGLRRFREPPGTPLWSALVGVALTVAAVAAVAVPIMGSPQAFPQHPDTTYHLGAALWMLERGDISTLHAAGFASSSGTGFYPAAFHGVVTTVAGLTGSSVTVSATVVALVTAAIVWPLGSMLLGRLVLGRGVAVTLATAVTSVAFTAFPFWLMGYGVLWPNLLGQALLPGALACLVAAVAPRDELGQLRALLILAASVPGLAIAHPNAIIALAMIGYVIAAERLAAQAWLRRRSHPRVAALIGAALVVGTTVAVALTVAITGRSVSMRGSNPRGAEVSVSKAVAQTIWFGPRGAPRLYVLGILVIAGVGVLLWRHQHFWVVISLALTAGLFIAVMGIDSPTTRLLTWPWYNNPPRLAALLVVPAMLTGAAALAALAQPLTRVRVGRGGPSWWPAVVWPAIFLLVTGGGYIREHRKVLTPYFRPVAARSWASAKELTALRELATRIPPDSVVAANPWNGGTFLYLVSGRSLLFPTDKVSLTGDRGLLAARLHEAGNSPEVCAAARQLHVDYVITGGRRAGSARAAGRYKGVDLVGPSPAFREVHAAGPYRLYQLTTCATG